MVKFKGSCDSRDLDNDSQFYYEKLVKWLNDNAVNDDECVEAIEVLDQLVELIQIDISKKSYKEGFDFGKEVGYDLGYQKGLEDS